jgi:predicted nuclease with TOPRIM domain
MSKRIKEYVKNVEVENDRLDTEREKALDENVKLKRELEQLKKINAQYEGCLSLIMEKFGWRDAEIGKTITKMLNEAAKNLLKK